MKYPTLAALLFPALLSAQSLDVTANPTTVRAGDTLYGIVAVPRAVDGRISGTSKVTWSVRQTRAVMVARTTHALGREAFAVTYDTGKAWQIGDWYHTTQNKHYRDSVLITVTPRTVATNPPPAPTPTPTPTPTPPVVIPQPIPGTNALTHEDLRRFTNTQQILAFCGMAGRGELSTDFWAGAGRDGNCNIPTLAGFGISYDLAEQAIRYDWGSRPNCPNGPSACSITVNMYPRVNPLGMTGNELWIRFTDKLSSNFKAGGGGAINSQIEYKYLFLDLATPQGVGQFQVELENGVYGTAATNFALRMKIVDYKSALTTTGVPGNLDAPLGAGFAGSYHTWVFGITNIGSSAVTFSAYLDGVLVKQITGPFFPGQPLSAVSVLGIQLGANINNGPDQAQSRWLRELGVYSSKPSLLPQQ